MKFFYLITLLIICCFTSCDGKYRTQETQKERLENSNLSDSYFVQETYFPETYTEVITDTILNSKLRVNIKYYSLLNKSILQNDRFNTNKNNKEYYRQFESQISVYKKDKLLFVDILNTSDFVEPDNSTFWNNAILQFVWLDEFESNEELIHIYCSFLVPDTNSFKSYKIYFNTLGERKIELIESS